MVRIKSHNGSTEGFVACKDLYTTLNKQLGKNEVGKLKVSGSLEETTGGKCSYESREMEEKSHQDRKKKTNKTNFKLEDFYPMPGPGKKEGPGGGKVSTTQSLPTQK